MNVEPLRDSVITPHAAAEMKRRDLSESVIRAILEAPEQLREVHPERIVVQSRVSLGESAKEYLITIFVDVARRLPEVVTAYRTSKTSKYWKEEP